MLVKLWFFLITFCIYQVRSDNGVKRTEINYPASINEENINDGVDTEDNYEKIKSSDKYIERKLYELGEKRNGNAPLDIYNIADGKAEDTASNVDPMEFEERDNNDEQMQIREVTNIGEKVHRSSDIGNNIIRKVKRAISTSKNMQTNRWNNYNTTYNHSYIYNYPRINNGHRNGSNFQNNGRFNLSNIHNSSRFNSFPRNGSIFQNNGRLSHSNIHNSSRFNSFPRNGSKFLNNRDNVTHLNGRRVNVTQFNERNNVHSNGRYRFNNGNNNGRHQNSTGPKLNGNNFKNPNINGNSTFFNGRNFNGSNISSNNRSRNGTSSVACQRKRKNGTSPKAITGRLDLNEGGLNISKQKIDSNYNIMNSGSCPDGTVYRYGYCIDIETAPDCDYDY